MVRNILAYIQDFFRLLFPYLCMHCRAELDHRNLLCPACQMELISYTEVKHGSQAMKDVFSGRIPIEQMGGLFVFAGKSPIQSLLHGLKYHSRKDVGRMFGKLIGRAIMDWEIRPDGIVPVPVHPKKLRIRGYNQSEIIAQAIAEETGIPLEKDLLSRAIHTQSNTKLSRWDRWQNVGRSFEWKAKDNGQGHYLLVDDVLTTGATIEACIQASLNNDSGTKWSVFTAAVVWRD